MSNGSQNCALEICCDLAGAKKKFAEKLAEEKNISQEYAAKCAEFVYEHFDLAERGTLAPFKKSVAKLARENP